MLTPKQRDFLIEGPEGIDAEPQSQKERNYRSAIRKRIREGLEDFDTIAANLETRDIEQIFYDPQTTDRLEKHQREQGRGEEADKISSIGLIPPLVSFLYLGTIQEEKLPSNLKESKNEFHNDPRLFESLIEQGIINAHRKRRNEVVDSVNVSIDVELGPQADELEEEELDELSNTELGILLDADKITIEEFIEAQDS